MILCILSYIISDNTTSHNSDKGVYGTTRGMIVQYDELLDGRRLVKIQFGYNTVDVETATYLLDSDMSTPLEQMYQIVLIEYNFEGMGNYINGSYIAGTITNLSNVVP